jgi:PAS domain S-box-containing protein
VKYSPSHPLHLTPGILLLTVAIFVADLLTPLGWSVWILYLIPLLLTFALPWAKMPLTFTSLYSVLVLVGFAYSPPVGSRAMDLFNRSLGIAVMWAFLFAMSSRATMRSDLTEALIGRETAERDRLFSALHLEAVLHSAKDAIVTVDEDQRILFFNEAAARMFQCPASEALGKRLDRFIPVRYQDAHREHIRAFGQSGVSTRKMGNLGIVTGIRADGLEFPIEASISQVSINAQPYFTAILRDVTDRQTVEEESRLVFESSPSGMLMVDERGSIVLVNTRIEEQFGYARQEMLGQPVEILIPERYRRRHVSDKEAFLKVPQGRPMGAGRDLYGVRKDGTEFSVEIGLTPIQTARGMRVLASIVDITQRKQMEERLNQTERLAELGTLASGMAHEIGTPMNVILGRAENLMRRTDEEATKKTLGIIISQVERITRIMNQLLTFARRRPIERRPMDLKQTIDDALEVIQERTKTHHVKIETSFADSLPAIYADSDQISQVLLNLFINAIHAMPDGGVLQVNVAQKDGAIRMVIADTGSGISEKDLSQIFTPFFTTKEVGKGTGLGLTVVHGIIQEHGGSISVQSKPGQGTAFTIDLPLAGESGKP